MSQTDPHTNSRKSRKGLTLFIWVVPLVFIVMGVYLLSHKGYLANNQQLPVIEPLPLSIGLEDVADQLSMVTLNELLAEAGEPSIKDDEVLLLFVLGTEVCWGTLVEVDQYIRAAMESEPNVRSLPLFVSHDARLARRMAIVSELENATSLYSADDYFLTAFGFSEDVVSRQFLLVVAPDGSIIDRRVIFGSVSPRAEKETFVDTLADLFHQ